MTVWCKRTLWDYVCKGINHVQEGSGARGVYAISVTAEPVGMGQQNLRLYERAGFLEPGRTEGGTRRYSDNEIVILRSIAKLLALSLNLSGIRLALSLEAENTALRLELSRHSDGPDDTAPEDKP